MASAGVAAPLRHGAARDGAERGFGTAAEAGRAFDAIADAYDAGFGRNPVGLLFRYEFQERARALFPPGARLLDIGCGTGEDALFLARCGYTVHGIDASPRMIGVASAKATEEGARAASFEHRGAEQIGTLPGPPFDGAYSNFGALNCADLEAAAHGLHKLLRPGARVLLSCIGPCPLPATLEQALTGKGRARSSRPLVGEAVPPVEYPSAAAVRRAFGPGFVWRGLFALGLLVPAPAHADWVWRHPITFGALAACERVLRRLPLLRALGDHFVLEGERL